MSSEAGQRAMECLRDSERWFPSIAHSVVHHTLSLAGEVGEFANIIKKADRGSIDLNEAVWRHRAVMELTDVYIYVLNLAALLGVDLDKAYELKRAENEKRFADAASRD